MNHVPLRVDDVYYGRVGRLRSSRWIYPEGLVLRRLRACSLRTEEIHCDVRPIPYRSLRPTDRKVNEGNVPAGSSAKNISDVRCEKYNVLVGWCLNIESLILSSAIISDFYALNRGVVCEWHNYPRNLCGRSPEESDVR